MNDEDTRHIATAIANAADEKKAEEILVLGLSKLLYFTDYFVICHASNDRQVRSISENIQVRMKEAGVRPLQISGEAEGRWVLLDYGCVVVHVFLEEARRFYDIERLWKDAPIVDWQNS